MNDRNKQEQGQTEIPYQTLSEFLENTPPNQSRYISDLYVEKMEYTGPFPTAWMETQHT